MSNSARRKIVEMHRELEQMRREKDVLRATIEITRQSPDFDDGGPLAEMLDEALAGKIPHMVKALERLAPLEPHTEVESSPPSLSREEYLAITNDCHLPSQLVGHPAIKQLAAKCFAAGWAWQQEDVATALVTAPKVLEGEVLPPESDLLRKARMLVEDLHSGKVV